MAARRFSKGFLKAEEMCQPIGREELHPQSSKALANSKTFGGKQLRNY
jgi:hypothetical protein